jgi:predicted ATP-dependent serine protease
MRSLTTRNLFDKRTGKTVTFQNEIFIRSIGEAEKKGIWLIYGSEKNGKTWFTLQLVKDMAAHERVAYISAEEGTDKSFRDALQRAGITPGDNILFDEYMPIEDLVAKYRKPRTANIIIIDNLMIYQDELKGAYAIRNLVTMLPNKLIVVVGHEERKEPYPAAARMAKKIAKVYVNIKGLKAFVVSRFAPQGGEISITGDMAEMYWG